ncbi:AAA family ATPase [Amycolatopsis minnesotensis]|uniref:ATPase AAA-type core domain-containing protein n=1 Tax=Amycolatopsis minnesotensis TaxID=337894 RepID=A0ABP5BGX3_9PSEU
MLRSFRLGNHRSFRDERELLLMPSMPGDERPAVPVAAIYGANASGKSSLFNGLFMQTAVSESLAVVSPVDFFRLGNEEADKPSFYIAELVVDAVRHTYGFSVQRGLVQEEWLYSYPEKRKRVVFERESGQVRFGSTVSDLKAKFTTLNELIRPDALMLSACGQLQLGPLMPVYRWFDGTLRIDSVESEANDLLSERVGAFVQRSPEHARRLLLLLAAADVGVTDIAVERVNEPIRARAMSYATVRPVSTPARLRWKVRLKHGSRGTPFDLRDESAGTFRTRRRIRMRRK